MEPSYNINLPWTQKVRLATTVFAIYWPLRFFINLNAFDVSKIELFWALIWLSEIPITIALFTFWISLTEWLETQLHTYSKRLSPRNGKLATQLATLLIAGMLSIGFDWAFFGLLHRARLVFDQTDRLSTTVLVTPTRPENRLSFKDERQRRHKAITALTIMALLMAYYLAANRRQDHLVAQLQLNAEQLKRQASQAQFEALKNQVNPHFLFNSLSILSSLVAVNPQLSIRFINHLSKAYRYILEQQDSERINLQTELDFLEAYCFLLNIRFDNKLQLVNTIVSSQASGYKIAPLTLQMLVENAVKHNQMSRKHPLIVSLAIQDDYLVISNPIRLRLPDEIFPENSTGIGLFNITNRYRLFTNRPVRISQSEHTFIVSIPLLL